MNWKQALKKFGRWLLRQAMEEVTTPKPPTRKTP
jgi:hypothetical protein